MGIKEKDNNDHVHYGHRERIKEMFLANGLKGMPDHVKLELLLFYCIPRADTNELAHILIKEFGTLRNVFLANYTDLMKVKGVGKNTALMLKVIPELVNVFCMDSITGDRYVADCSEMVKYFVGMYACEKFEKIKICLLGSKLRIIKTIDIASGELTPVDFNISDIIFEAQKRNATRVVISHNHPDGYSHPSQDDINATKRIYQSLQSVGITLVDHIIVGRHEGSSMRAGGYFQAFEAAK